MEGTILDHSRRGGADHGKRTRSDGVRHGKCRGGEQSRLRCVLAIFFKFKKFKLCRGPWGRKKTVLTVPAKVSRKCKRKVLRNPSLFVEPYTKSSCL
jgi:hypothetical protein